MPSLSKYFRVPAIIPFIITVTAGVILSVTHERNFRMFKLLSITICCWMLLSCGTTKEAKGNSVKMFRDSIPIAPFCDLPHYTGTTVYLKSYYAGIDEYWSLDNIEKKPCKPNLTVDLQFSGTNPFDPPAKFQSLFLKAHENYHNTYLLIEAIGVFENDSKTGYGHLGSNKSRFVVSELLNVTLFKR